MLEYADIIIAVLGVLTIAWIADQWAGRRGFGGASLVSGVGAACGWFLAVRVFAFYTMDDWQWVGWALGGAGLALGTFYLFRSKR